MKMAGFNKRDPVHTGLRSLLHNELLTREKKGRHNVYYLINNAIWMGGSYFPMTEYRFTKGWWADLLPCEKAVFIVLAVKGVIKNPDVPLEFTKEALDDKIHSHGIIQPTKWLRLAGVTKQSWYNALSGLCEKNWIGTTKNSQYVIYK